MIEDLINSVDDIDKDKQELLNKSLYDLADEMKNETLAPSLDSYGNDGVYLRYKRN